jgi:hypothetical protein
MAQCVLIDAVKRKEINITRMFTGASGPGEGAGGNNVVGGSKSGGSGEKGDKLKLATMVGTGPRCHHAQMLVPKKPPKYPN